MHPDDPTTEQATEVLKAMAHPVRISVLYALLNNEVKVCELCERMAMSQPAMSQHLARLREIGLIVGRRDLTARYYRVASEREAMVRVILAQVALLPRPEAA